jgi:hypothetical protein
MFFKTKRNRCKTTRQTLHTEQLEPKAMFSASPVEPVVALDVGPVNQANVENCMVIEPVFNVGEDGRMVIEPVFNVGDDIFMPKPNRITGSADPGGDDVFMPKPNRIGGTSGPGGTSFMTGVNSLAQANQQPQIASVWTNGNATSMAPRHAAFAMMRR